MDKDIDERIDDIARFFNDCLCGGSNSISADDEIWADVLVVDEVNDVLDLTTSGHGISGERLDFLSAVRTVADVWNSGYDLASGRDRMDDDRMVSEVVFAYMEHMEREAAPAPAATVGYR